MKDKIFIILFFIFPCIVLAGSGTILNPSLSILQDKELFEQSGFIFRQLNNIIKSRIFLMIILFVLPWILSLFVEPSMQFGITPPATFLMIFCNLYIILKFITAQNHTARLILLTLGVIFFIILVFNIACSFANGKDKDTYYLIEKSYVIMFLLFLLEIFIIFFLGLHAIYAKITSKDKVITNEVEQKTLSLTNESIKTDTKPIEDNEIKHNKNVEQTVTERGLAQTIANMQVKMEYYPLKKDFLYQIARIEPKMIDANEINSELRARLNNNDDDLELAEIEMNYAYTLLEETKQKLINLEKEKYELENSKHRILKQPRSIFYKHILQSIKINKSFLSNYEDHFESAKFKYALLKWEQSFTEDEDSNIK